MPRYAFRRPTLYLPRRKSNAGRMECGRGRDASYPAPPAQIRTCGFPAYGSCLGSNRCTAFAAYRMRPSACDTLARCCARLRALLVRIPLGHRPWLHRLRGGSLPLVRRLPSYYGGIRLPAPVHHRLRLPAFPMRTAGAIRARPDAGPPKFRHDPFAPDRLFDPRRAAMPRITALLMLRSTIETASAPAISPFRGSITHPTQSLCTLRGRRCRRLTQHSLPGGLLGLTWAGLAPADRASFAWRLP